MDVDEAALKPKLGSPHAALYKARRRQTTDPSSYSAQQPKTHKRKELVVKVKKIEDNNTLIFLVNPKTNKHQIKSDVEKKLGIKVICIKTLNMPDGTKKAFVKLANELCP